MFQEEVGANLLLSNKVHHTLGLQEMINTLKKSQSHDVSAKIHLQ